MIFKIIFSLLILTNPVIGFAQRILNADEIHSNTSTGSMCIDPTTILSCSEMSYLDGVTSNIQTQLNGKQATGNYITALTGDVSASGPGSVAATVNSVGGVTAANVASGSNDANAATASALPNTIVKRDGSTNFSAGTITATLNGVANNISGVAAIANGGTGQSNAQAGINNLSNNSMTAANGDLFQWSGGNAQFLPYVAPGTTGTPNTLSYYDPSGDLATLPNWGVDPNNFGLYNNLSYSSIDGDNINFNDFTIGIGMSVDSPSSNATAYSETMNHDNAASSFDFNNVYMRRMELRLNGNGHVNYSNNLGLRHLLGNGSTTGELGDGNAIDNYVNVATGFSVLGTYNLFNNSATIDGTVANVYANNNFINGSGQADNATGFNLGIQVEVLNTMQLASISSNQPVGGDYFGLGLYSDSTVGNNANLINMNQTQNVVANLNFINSYVPNTVTIGSDFRAAQLGNDGAVANNSAGILNTQNGTVTKSHTGFGSYVGADVGDGTGNNLIHFDGSSQHTPARTVTGNIFGLNISNNSIIAGNNTFNGANINNQGAGYRFNGLNVYNSADMSEEIRGIQSNTQGDTRTTTGLDVYMQGNATDDAQAIRVNVTNQTSSSTANHVKSLDLQGGTVSIQSQSAPFSGANVDVGNNYTHTMEIANGSPVTGTDIIQTLIQNNLLLHDTITTGPFGLDFNAIGLVNQIAFDSGVTQSLYRNVLMGTTVPAGSGGTLDTWVNLEMIGLSSFGGSVTNNYRIGIQDAQLVGQNWCDNVSIDCWFMRIRDERAENLLGRLAINTANQKVSTNVRLELNDGHIKHTQTTAPVPTVDANAGSGANCTVSGTDSDGVLDIEMGSSGWASGAQCSVVFDKAYGANPICTFSPKNGDAGEAPSTVQPWMDTSTTDMVMFFNIAETASKEYRWAYHCVEAF